MENEIRPALPGIYKFIGIPGARSDFYRRWTGSVWKWGEENLDDAMKSTDTIAMHIVLRQKGEGITWTYFCDPDGNLPSIPPTQEQLELF
jgi:hypothetical protein